MGASKIQDLWKQYKIDGDIRARDALIQHYAYLVKITSGRVVSNPPPNVEREDLIGAGIIGLIKSVDQFDASRQVKFETYAIALIRGAILEMLREEDWVPRSIRERVKLLERTYLQMETWMGRPATEEEVAEAMGVEIEEFYKLLADTGRACVLSLDDVVLTGEGGEQIFLSDVVYDNEEDTHGDVENKAVKESLAESINRLPDREKLLIALYYYEGMTFKEIGRILDVSESRVYQLHTQSVLRLKGYLSQDQEMFRR